jgi:exopolysaccharide biosynthesis polyprenyl glycosylphosphotransferase
MTAETAPTLWTDLSGSDLYLRLASSSAAAWRRSQRTRALKTAMYVFVDTTACCVGAFGAIILKRRELPFFVNGSSSLTYGLLAQISVLVQILTVAWAGGYSFSRFASATKELFAIIRSGVLFLSLATLAAVAFKLDISRGFLAAVAAISTGTLLSFRVVLKLGQIRLRRTNGFQHRVLLVGGENSLATVGSALRGDRRVVMAGTLDCGQFDGEDLADAILSDIAAFHANVVIFSDSSVLVGHFAGLVASLAALNCSVLAAPEATALSLGRGQAVDLGGRMFLEAATQTPHGYRFAKLILDRVLAAIALIGLSPLLLVVAALVKHDSKGPLLFRQVRVGQNGKPFRILKFRTMVTDAEERLKRDGLWETYVQNDFKLPAGQDPRVTPLGRTLRRLSLDELPQLWNVLVGSMSLVGPRPIVPVELSLYRSLAPIYLSLKPGLTGLWQVSGRSDVVFPERAYFDEEYVRRQSMQFDLGLIFKTIQVVRRASGAH